MRDGRMTHTGVSIGRGRKVDARGHTYGVVRRPISGIVHALGAAEYRLRCAGYGGKSTPAVQRTLRMGSGGRCAHAAKHAEAARLLNGAADGKFGAATRER
ncbi:MAG: hypothetical protein ACLUI3_12300 [Christensenellales bacterium]